MNVYSMDANELSLTLTAALTRLGQLGLEGREALVARLTGSGDDDHLQEGMGQMGDALAEVGVE